MSSIKHTYVGMQLLRYLVGQQGLRIFTIEQAKSAAETLKIQTKYVVKYLHYLLKDQWIWRLKKGVYAVNSASGLGTSPHEYEIATAIVQPCAISHWSAMHYHHLTQQIPNTIFAITTAGTSIPRSLPKKIYHYVQVKPDHYFGIEKVWIEQSQVMITDLERTLLDGLMKPQYCGDFQEVLYAFKVAHKRINLYKLIDYALLLDGATIKRLGYILQKLGYTDSELSKLLIASVTGYRKLDPTGPNRGTCNKKWMIIDNIGASHDSTT